MLNVLLLGVIHEYQYVRDGEQCVFSENQRAALNEQRRFYGEWVRRRTRDYRSELIFDEMNLPEDATTAKLVDTGILWVYMDIPQGVRQRFGLSKEPRLPGEELIPSIDEPRERHWLLVIESISAECNLDRIVAICGCAHLESFSGKLRERGHEVETQSVRDQTWNDESWCPSRSINSHSHFPADRASA